MTVNSPSTSLTLLRLIQSRDEDAWNTFSELYGPLVYSWVRKAGLQDADSVDVVQSVFFAVAKGIGRFEKTTEDHSLRGWLWTVTRNAVRKHCNRNANDANEVIGGTSAYIRLNAVPDFLDSEIEPDQETESARLVNRAIGIIRQEFKESSWQAFWRMTVEAHSAADIAKDLHLSESAVRQGKYRVLCRLRELLDGI